MKKLELKHLAPYLPYKLRVKYWDRNVVMNAGNGSSSNWIGITALLQRQNKIECLPILRPLSDLTKEIEVNGEKFIPMEWFHINYVGETMFKNPATWSHRSVTKMFEWNIDVFGLIEKGLAIDINTL